MRNTVVLASLAASALAAPAIVPRTEESWTINTMTVHFMGRDSGLPGGQWPDADKFPTELNFTVDFPSGDSAQCSTTWPEGQTPQQAPITCASGNAQFTVAPIPGQAFGDATFILGVQRTVVDTASGNQVTFTSQQQIANDDPSNPNSYLTCLGGAPLTGIHCSLNGPLSKPGPIRLNAVSS